MEEISLKIYIKTLGCEKNTVDSEFAAGLLVSKGNEIVEDPEKSDIMLVNTCGFINDAKTQSIETIFNLASIKSEKQKLFVSGCLSQRYAKDLKKLMPEVDGFFGVNDYAKLPDFLDKLDFDPQVSKAGKEFEELGCRLISNRKTPWTASIKIAEGCNNICTYCIIPFIRGRYRSRKPEIILKEAQELADSGVKELIIIAQDVTAYGCDFGQKNALPALLHNLCKIENLKWIRLMYCYEDEITQELIDAIKEEDKICKYIDIPIQHCDDGILKAMNRKSTNASIRATIENLRKQIPEIIIRTTLITGFPGEMKKEYFLLKNFVKDMNFDRLGVFSYSKEEGTAAYRMKNQVRKDVKENRKNRIMEAQRLISLHNNQKYIGKTLQVLVEEDCEDGTYIGRSSMDAPEIDNAVLFTSSKKLNLGDFVFVFIEDAFDYDLSGKVVENEFAK